VAERLLVAVALLIGVTGCYYQDPYKEAAAHAAATPAMKLERAFLSATLESSGQPGLPTNSFPASHDVFACAVLSGQGGSEVKFVLLPHEGSGSELAAFYVKVDDSRPLVVQNISPAGSTLGPGKYYLSVVVNGVPSWGLPFTVTSPSVGGPA